eukprot:398660_1
MISIISLLAWIMCSHVVVSQKYLLKEVRGRSKVLSYEGKEIGTIGHGDCLQVRDDNTDPAQIIFHVQLDGHRWKGVHSRLGDTTVESDLEQAGYPQLHRSVWSATLPESAVAGRCNDPVGSYEYETMLIGHTSRGHMRRARGAGLKKPKKKKKKKKKTTAKVKSVFGVKEKHTKPLRKIEVDEWKFQTTKSGEKRLFHFGKHVCSLERGESIVLSLRTDPGYEYGVFHLKTNGKWGITLHGGETDDAVIHQITMHEHEDPNMFELWLKKLDGTKKQVAVLEGKGFVGAAADAYVEYEDEMEGFASKYDELLDQFEYDVEIEAAREKKAMTHLAKETYGILRAKNRENEYW